MVDNGGFTLDGIPATTYGITLKYAPGQPALPESRDRTAEIPGRAGAYWFDSDLGSRVFSLPCHFVGAADAAALDALIRAFARVLVDVNGRPRTLSLAFDDSPTLSYTVRYSGGVPFDRAWVGVSDFTLPLIADDPFAYQAEDTAADTITANPGALTVESDGTVNTPAQICITNNGGAAVEGFVITIEYEV